jgi:hypothetical protein
MGETIVHTQPVDLDKLPLFVTFAEAAALLGGSKPYSTKTIQRLVAADRLQAVGERQGRRIVGKSLRRLIAELEEGKPLWLEKGSNAANTVPVRPIKTKRANGSRRSRSDAAKKTLGVSLQNKRGMRGGQR